MLRVTRRFMDLFLCSFTWKFNKYGWSYL